jgi:16S rRNA G966 N2-methylase RsmD
MNSFPFWSKSLPSAKEMFLNLKTQELNIIDDKYGNKILQRIYPIDYLNCDHISNHFTENIRITCQFANYSTPFEIWKNIKLDKKYKMLSLIEKREYIYNNTRECNTFNVTFCLWIINSLGYNLKILDPSSGWGDRLIAALASNAKSYTGFDPNKKLQKGYKKIVKELNDKNNTIVNIKAIPFESAKLKQNYYDLAITSPPYFSLEKYSNDINQSNVKYNEYENWLTNFYSIYLLKMIESIKQYGYIVIYIEDIIIDGQKYNLREYTIKTMKESNLVKLCDKFGLKVGKNVRYALVWQKL